MTHVPYYNASTTYHKTCIFLETAQYCLKRYHTFCNFLKHSFEMNFLSDNYLFLCSRYIQTHHIKTIDLPKAIRKKLRKNSSRRQNLKGSRGQHCQMTRIPVFSPSVFKACCCQKASCSFSSVSPFSGLRRDAFSDSSPNSFEYSVQRLSKDISSGTGTKLA